MIKSLVDDERLITRVADEIAQRVQPHCNQLSDFCITKINQSFAKAFSTF